MDDQPPASRIAASAGAYAWYIVLILMLCQVLSHLDAKLPFILVEALKHDLRLSDTQIGIITGPVFSFTYAVFGLPIAKISDRYVRKYVIAAAIIIWSVCTAGGGLASGFAAFAVSRMGVALAESALMPAAHSIIAGYMPRATRPKAIAIYALGIPFGAFLALWLGGYMADSYGWRWALVLVGLCGIGLAIVVLASVKEPPREAVRSTPSMLPTGHLGSLLGDPIIRNLVLGGGLLALSSGAFLGWLPAYIMRSYHLSATDTGQSFGIVVGAIGAAGTLAGGYIASLLSARRQSMAIWAVAVAVVLAGIFQVLSMLTVRYSLFLPLTAMSVLFTLFYFAPTFATIQSQVDPGARAFATAVTLFATNGIGLALGPFVAGVLSDLLAPVFGQESLRWSLVILSTFSVWSVLHYAAAARALGRRDKVAV